MNLTRPCSAPPFSRRRRDRNWTTSASGSSWKSFAREGVAMDDPGCRQGVTLSERGEFQRSRSRVPAATTISAKSARPDRRTSLFVACWPARYRAGACKRSELNRQQRRCQPGGNRRPIAVRKVHTLRSTGPGTSAAVCGGMLMVGRLSKPPRRSRPTPAQMGPCMAIVTAARNGARRRTDAR
jgi:hypothetical protein